MAKEGTIKERVLQIAEQVGALKYGDFTLASGAKSNYYFDGRLISLHPEGSHLLGLAMLAEITDSEIGSVGGPATAAIPLVTAISLVSHLEGKNLNGFFVRSETKEHGTQKQIEGSLQEGMKVAIVDDVCTSGGSLFLAIDAVEKIGCEVGVVLAILDRKQGGSKELTKRGYAFRTLLEATDQGAVVVSN